MSETTESFYGYYVSWDATGVREIDAMLKVLASECRAYHHTENWRDADDGDLSSCERIQRVANESASQIAALTQRVEQAERERDESVRELKLCENCQLLKLTAAESEVKRLLEGIEGIKADEWFNEDELEKDYPFTMVGCDPLRKAFALLAQPSDEKDNPDAQ